MRHTTLSLSLWLALLPLALPLGSCKHLWGTDPNNSGGPVAAVSTPKAATPDATTASGVPAAAAADGTALAGAWADLSSLSCGTDFRGAAGSQQPGHAATPGASAGEQVMLLPGTSINAKIVAYHTPKGAAQDGCFAARLTNPIRLNGHVVAAAGSGAKGMIQTLPSGTVLHLDQIITPDGKAYRPRGAWMAQTDSDANAPSAARSPVESTIDLDAKIQNGEDLSSIPKTVTFESNSAVPSRHAAMKARTAEARPESAAQRPH